MRPTFLLGEMLLEQLCWDLSLLPEKVRDPSCAGTVLCPTSTAFTLNAGHSTKLAHQARAHRPFSVDARLDLGASSAMNQERSTLRNDVPLSFGLFHLELRGTSAQRKGFLWGKV